MSSYASATKNMDSFRKERKVEYRSRDVTDKCEESDIDTPVVNGDYESSENCTTDNVDDDVIEDTYMFVSEYITNFGNKFEKDYPDYNNNDKSNIRIAKTKSFFQLLSANWCPLAFTNKMKEERLQEQIKKAADKALADKVRENNRILALEQLRERESSISFITEERDRLDEIMLSIPIESKAFRLAREAREASKKAKETEKFEKERKAFILRTELIKKAKAINKRAAKKMKEEESESSNVITGNAERDRLINEGIERKKRIVEMMTQENQDKANETYEVEIDTEVSEEEKEAMNEALQTAMAITTTTYESKIVFEPVNLKAEAKAAKIEAELKESKEWTLVQMKKKSQDKLPTVSSIFTYRSYATEQYAKNAAEFNARQAKRVLERQIKREEIMKHADIMGEDVAEVSTNEERTLAFEKLKTAKGTSKSQMCSSVESGDKCKHGAKCRFAHTIYELTPMECFFGNKCQFIVSSKKKCMCIHSVENKEEYCKRVGIKSQDSYIPKMIYIPAPQMEVQVPIPPVQEIDNVRAIGFEKLKSASAGQTKSQMCSSVESGDKCKHGAKCRFAHTIYELTPTECFFGNQCQLIMSLVKKCMCIHPDKENKEEYCQRVGLTQSQTPTPTPKVKRVCLSVGTNTPCPHGAKCKFLHTPTTTTPPIPVICVEVPTPAPRAKRLCMSVGTNTPCPHGAKCKFLHTPTTTPQEQLAKSEKERLENEIAKLQAQLSLFTNESDSFKQVLLKF